MKHLKGVNRPFLAVTATGCPVNDDGEEIQRLWFPEYGLMYRGAPDAELVRYSAEDHVNRLKVPSPETPDFEIRAKASLVVSICAASCGKGKPTAQAAWGVFLGPGSKFNSSGKLSPSCPQTRARAEIEALSRALDTIRRMRTHGVAMHEIKIRSDSEYICQAMSMRIEGWIKTGGVKSKRHGPVAHFDKLKQIHEEMNEMTSGDGGGLWLQFWLVWRDKNVEADALAHEALESASISAPEKEE